MNNVLNDNDDFICCDEAATALFEQTDDSPELTYFIKWKQQESHPPSTDVKLEDLQDFCGHAMFPKHTIYAMLKEYSHLPTSGYLVGKATRKWAAENVKENIAETQVECHECEIVTIVSLLRKKNHSQCENPSRHKIEQTSQPENIHQKSSHDVTMTNAGKDEAASTDVQPERRGAEITAEEGGWETDNEEGNDVNETIMS